MQQAAISSHDSLVIAVLAAAIALGLTLTTPTVGMQAAVGFLIVITAFTSVSAALYLLIASMLLFSTLESRPVLHEIVIAVFMAVTTPVTFMLLVRAALHRDRADGDNPVARRR